jgi:hypothetical protein
MGSLANNGIAIVKERAPVATRVRLECLRLDRSGEETLP